MVQHCSRALWVSQVLVQRAKTAGLWAQQFLYATGGSSKAIDETHTYSLIMTGKKILLQGKIWVWEKKNRTVSYIGAMRLNRRCLVSTSVSPTSSVLTSAGLSAPTLITTSTPYHRHLQAKQSTATHSGPCKIQTLYKVEEDCPPAVIATSPFVALQTCKEDEEGDDEEAHVLQPLPSCKLLKFLGGAT